ARGAKAGSNGGTRGERLASAVLQSGGILLLIPIAIAYLAQLIVAGDPITPSGLLFVLLLTAVTLLGGLIDFLERRQKGTRRGRRLLKFGGQGAIGVAFGLAALTFANSRGLTPASGYISFVTNLKFDFLTVGLLGLVAAVVWIAVIIVGGASAVSVIEGYDGLAAGLAAMALVGYVFVTAWQYNESCLNLTLARENLYKCYSTSDPESLVEIAAVVLASLLGFIWWNTHPAQVQLGESGSFLLGCAIAALAIMTDTELLLILFFAVFAVFARVALPPKSTRTPSRRWPLPAIPSARGRLLVAGTSEITIVVRFWILAALLSAAGIAIFYGTWLSK
ncbi:MAG: phospho-N-acetylmuramoyl-pentapeptide-transferase, partial [Actinomycetota bacterium]|nr:phospho-N-acetylmuramoyl-pentapeptide-transferase [Actinomycetota bacterium]